MEIWHKKIQPHRSWLVQRYSSQANNIYIYIYIIASYLPCLLVNYSDLWFSCMFANDIKVNYNFAGNNVPLCFRSIDHCTGMMTPLHIGAFSAWLSFCDASPPVTGGFPSQRTIQMGIRLFCWEHQQAVKRTIRLLVILPVMMQLRLHLTYYWLDFIHSTLSVLRKQFMHANTEE